MKISRVVELFPAYVEAGSPQYVWATSMGKDLARAWAECPTAVWLLEMSSVAGVSLELRNEAMYGWDFSSDEGAEGQDARWDAQRQTLRDAEFHTKAKARIEAGLSPVDSTEIDRIARGRFHTLIQIEDYVEVVEDH